MKRVRPRTPRESRRRRAASWLALAAVAVGLGSCCCSKDNTDDPPPPAPAAEEHGTYRVASGVPVLTLWGTPYQRGFAHGKLVAPQILETADVIAGTHLLLWDPGDYERVIIPMMERFRFSADDEAELRGLLDGIQAAVGEEAVLERLDRPITLADLKAYNTAGDWYRQACSSFAAWGKRGENGHVWVGRNFDFLPSKMFYKNQMIVVHRRRAEKKAWATVTAPGMIGCVTGMNEDGVFVSVHDVFLKRRPLEKGYTPRLLTLRRLMETCEARDLDAQARPLLEARKQMFDNAILLAAPVTDGTLPALVFEYNNDYSKDKGVTVRTSADNSGLFSDEMILCTNHFRKRVGRKLTPARYRYPLMQTVMLNRTKKGRGMNFHGARRTMGAARLPITIHTAIADLNTFEFWFASGKYLNPPGGRDFVKLPMDEWLHPEKAR
ncbi:MAG: C45 family peptidase [Planctomycetota bacterium]